jgi:hypothetical protein
MGSISIDVALLSALFLRWPLFSRLHRHSSVQGWLDHPVHVFLIGALKQRLSAVRHRTESAECLPLPPFPLPALDRVPLSHQGGLLCDAFESHRKHTACRALCGMAYAAFAVGLLGCSWGWLLHCLP